MTQHILPIRNTLILLLAGTVLAVTGCSQPAEKPQSEEKSPAQEKRTAEPTAIGENPAEAATPPESPARAGVLPLPMSNEDLTAGWIWLFDGSTLFGWEAAGKANWRVENGEIRVDKGEVGLLCTTATFANYELVLEFKAAAGTNSGVFLQTPLQPTDPAADCYELNIAPADNPFPTGSLVKRKRHEGAVAPDRWQELHITVQEGHIQVQLDGQQVMDYNDPAPITHGRIGLQLNQGAIAFRKIRLRPLAMKSLFNGKDLAGWKTYPDMASRFQVTDEGLLNVQDGRGQLETRQVYADFVMQLECITHADELNSGIFFRCIPGETMNGYECQIHNGIKDGDPTLPADAGTGGIFRRTTARRVVARDQEWFHLTLLAHGPQISTWVNGFQVSNWVDERKPDPNPRRGLRLEAGTIMIQGHDPTTNISFRNLRISTLGSDSFKSGG